MKTNQEMIRIIDSFSVIQRTSDGYFDGSEYCVNGIAFRIIQEGK